MNTLKSLLRDATTRLKRSSPTPQLDAEILFAYALKKQRAFLYAYGDDILADETLERIEALISERLRGVPIAYLVKEREFWSLSFHVTPHTLIPRPETELLIELALNLYGAHETCSVLELGTGTGAISIALATEKPHWQLITSDQSINALAVAEKNIKRHHVKNITLIHSNWFDQIPDAAFDLIISNPPYLADDDPHQHQGDLRFEPKEALISDENGLSDLNIIIQESIKYLKQDGLLLLEHGYNQRKAVMDKLSLTGYKNVRCWQDTNNNDRVSTGWKKV